MIDVSALSIRELKNCERALDLIINTGNAKSDDYPLHEAVRREIMRRHFVPNYKITGVTI